MKYSFSNSQMREADRLTIEGGISAQELMERAGTALAQTILNAMEKLGIDDALIVCGGGNNGGDGFVAARILEEAGKEISVLCFAEIFSADCAAAKAKYKGEILGRMPRRMYLLVADCLFGTGLDRAPEGDNAALIGFINSSGAYVVACDLPSGLGENGVAYTPCVRADETVAMGQLKNALLLSDGADYAGKITVAEIGIAAQSGAEVWERENAAQYFPKRKSNSNKGSYGAACILAGGAYSGAAFLAGGACLKSGAGYTRLCVPKKIYPSAIGKFPACILKECDRIDDDVLSSDCVALGMGAGLDDNLYALIGSLLTSYHGTLVLDADALNMLAKSGVGLLKNKDCRVIITPHPKEFSRLTGKSVEEILASPIECAKAFAREYGVVVALKNNRTVITDGDRVAINITGSPALAKGGSGDVLSGLLAGTVARGVEPYEAACVSAYILGKAGERAAEEMGEYAPDATDIIGYLPAVMREIVS